MAKSHPTRLLTTRASAAVAAVVTAFVLALAIRGQLHPAHAESTWLLPLDGVQHRSPAIALNVALYAYLCWLAFWLIRGTGGRERLFMVGWFADILLSPLGTLGPHWSMTIKYVGTFGLAVALIVALSLVLSPPGVTGSSP